ncbi:TolC family protein [Arenibacter aquaticus]|uniref:TolC family protein n=1 Tax=Arenibacter aquaticus TaxID=2489054 RepID=A0A430K7L3_9FLAO|nr:TolC family protein [Arenibacter aquaticus]RTE55002.1 TolC family protein [Arenibacter aquaticus]
MKLKGIIGFFIFCLGSMTAQEKKWTLEECVYYAVENNLTIAQYELDLENAQIDKSDAIGDMLPNFNMNARISGNSGLVLDQSRNQQVSGTVTTASGGFGSSVNLFDGLRNIHRLNRAKLNALANQYRLDNLKDDIMLAVANAYLQVASNKESLKVFRAQYAVTEQDLTRTEELVAAGVVPKGDLLEIQATAANQEQQIVNGENQVLLARINLAQLLQITDYENFDIAEEDFNISPSNILEQSPKTIFNKALSFRNDIKFSMSNVELAMKDLQIAKGAAYPTLGAFFNYGTQYSSEFRNPATLERIPFTDQLYLTDGIAYGLQLNIPVFNGFSVKNNIKRAKIGVDRSRLQLEQDKLDLENNINQAYVDVKSFSKAYEAAQKTLDARRLAYNYSKERFEVGLMNAFDFSQAQSRVDNAEAELIRTKYDYIFRVKVLEFYFGLPITLD